MDGQCAEAKNIIEKAASGDVMWAILQIGGSIDYSESEDDLLRSSSIEDERYSLYSLDDPTKLSDKLRRLKVKLEKSKLPPLSVSEILSIIKPDIWIEIAKQLKMNEVHKD
ncbi:MAG: hypothetical protein A2821_00240 [Candidatus Magasanikbacteria bacterium RIFCSPHIGHO2_01_FULL_41_23]|uniref:Uncharacterized protein n=1 Tax=Candidatus Magasanikbacteria bacterium RIFCSPLOWO2_01_FULL_40_15 TaxID=1798686 RepID=A0A1F6N3J6_9BACT|nr:MAG: hypothetical protein A2821_00240 [Candidatus Magasanikbacteria bacterium RIFCSPHIGHO2_01_FULL_41_23]OGH78556.1 MAG: hypothetical protein A2983_02730 [Candidatus Magasanikbacteria bacterium RIFCSPLOWO2_01_FULL_40_15]